MAHSNYPVQSTDNFSQQFSKFISKGTTLYQIRLMTHHTKFLNSHYNSVLK